LHAKAVRYRLDLIATPPTGNSLDFANRAAETAAAGRPGDTAMALPVHKTKIVATIGPASDQPEMLRALIEAGLSIARLNFSHGSPEYHAAVIGRIREAAEACARRVAIMGDLPGPKMRIGDLTNEPVELMRDQRITLTTDDCPGTADRVSVSFAGLPAAVKRGDALFLNDGFIQLEVIEVRGNDVHCRVHTGGELRSRKGLNLPGIDLGISAFTANDREWLGFAAEHGIDAVSQSFVATADDLEAVRAEAARLGYEPFIIAKIERAAALEIWTPFFGPPTASWSHAVISAWRSRSRPSPWYSAASRSRPTASASR
jgi:pyruvate kinase